MEKRFLKSKQFSRIVSYDLEIIVISICYLSSIGKPYGFSLSADPPHIKRRARGERPLVNE